MVPQQDFLYPRECDTLEEQKMALRQTILQHLVGAIFEYYLYDF